MIERRLLRFDPWIGQRFQKRHQIRLLSIGHWLAVHAYGCDIGIELRIVWEVPAPTIEIDHLFQDSHAAIMHIRACQFDVAQRRGFEGPSDGCPKICNRIMLTATTMKALSFTERVKWSWGRARARG